MTHPKQNYMRKNQPFPIEKSDPDLCSFLRNAWESGWFDDYADEHFLIQAIEGKLSTFVGKEQMIQNNIDTQGIVMPDGNIKIPSFCFNFCVNLSQKLRHLSKIFSANDIKNFITNQLSAGKKHYDENTFFQALSEISVLAFYASRGGWNQAEYEPSSVKNGKNPEARFTGSLLCRLSSQPDEEVEQHVIVNVEVKAPKFPKEIYQQTDIILPITLLSEHGRAIIPEFCIQHGIAYLSPRIKKLKDFLNSAASKFSIPKEHEYNLLYINWSYCDFPVNGFLEAWGLLTNEVNGILNHPEIAKSVGVVPDVFQKITAVIVYTESLEGLMFSDLRFIWQRNGVGPRFRLWVLDPKLREAELANQSDILLHITGMNPDQNEKRLFLSSYQNKSFEELANLNQRLVELMEQNALQA